MCGHNFRLIIVLLLVLACGIPSQVSLAGNPSPNRHFIDRETMIEPSREMGRSDNELPGTSLSFDNLSLLGVDAEVKAHELNAALCDGSDATVVEFAPQTEGAVLFHFPGAARWINEVEIRFAGRADFAVDGLLPTHGWRKGIGRIEARSEDGESGKIVSTLDGARYQAIRLRLLNDFNASASFAISEVGMFWFEEEMTRDAKEVAGEWCEDYAGTDNDLSSPSETVGRFLDYFDDHGWTLLFEFGNDMAWEEDFKRHDLGGTNGSFVDATDHIIYCGHGTTDATSMSRTDRDDGNVTAADISGAWDGDLEWGWFHCCLNMSTTAWHNALANCHTICGSINVINGSQNWGETIAKKLDSTWFADPAWTIWQSWWHSNDTHQPAGNQFRMLAEDQVHYNENIWGEGNTESDSNDGTHWTTSQTVSKDRASAQIFYGRPFYSSSEPVLWEPPANLGEPGRPALKVYVRPEVLTKEYRREIEVFDVQPVQMNEQVVSQAFVSICTALGLDYSNIAAGAEGEGGFTAASGLASLSGFSASGGLMFDDQEVHNIPRTHPLDMISGTVAEEIATQFLGSIGLLEPGHFVADVSVMSVKEFRGDEVLSEFPFAYDVIFGRKLGPSGEDLAVLGPGGRIHVCVGPDGRIQAFNNTCRRVQPGGTISPIEVSMALDHLAAFGYQSLQSPPEFYATEILVNEAGLAYYEKDISTNQGRLGPIYFMDVVLSDDSGLYGAEKVSVPGRIYMSADAPPIRARIDTPTDGTSTQYGSEVRFEGTAINGVGPYQFRWTSQNQGVLSTQQTFTTSDLIAGVHEPGVIEPVNIELQVTDANGYVSSDQISLIITGLTGIEDDVPSTFKLVQNHPNPFNPRTTIAFSLATPGNVTLVVYDMQGRAVKTLIDGELSAGPNSIVWDSSTDAGRPAAAGIYLYRLNQKCADGTTSSEERKMVLIK